MARHTLVQNLRRFLKKYAGELGISDIQSEGCYYVTFKAKDGAAGQLIPTLVQIIERDGLDTAALIGEGECPVYDKYDDYIPAELLREAYAEDKLRADELIERVAEWSSL